MLADASARSSSAQEPFRASLNQSSASKPQTPTASPSPRRPVAPPQAKTTPATPRLLTSPPRKNTIRLVENDQNNRREKYDGSRWRLVCVGNDNECTNLAYARGLCGKHYTQQRSTEPPPAKKRKLLVHHFSVPTMGRWIGRRDVDWQECNDDFVLFQETKHGMPGRILSPMFVEIQQIVIKRMPLMMMMTLRLSKSYLK